MVIGMVSGAVKFFFPIPRFFSSHLPTSIYFSPPSHALSPYPSLYLSSFHFFFFNLYLSLFIFFLLSFFFYSFCFPFLPSHEFFFFFFLFFPLFHFLFLLSKIFSELCQICSILLYTIISFLNPFVVLSAYFLFIHFSFLVFLFLFSQFFNKL